MKKTNANDEPIIGMALWLLAGGNLVDRIEWAARNEFTGLALLQSIAGTDPAEREDAAAAIREHNLALTYHGNVHHKLNEDGSLDTDFADAVAADALWWHEHAAPVACCCADPINYDGKNGEAFNPAENLKLLECYTNAFAESGIQTGIENGFHYERYRRIADFSRFHEQCEERDLHPGMLFDGGHAHVHLHSGGTEDQMSIGDYIRAIPLTILEVHLCDNHGEKDEHLAIGRGNMDIDGLFAALAEVNFRGAYTVEVCKNILAGEYGSDITNPQETDALLISRDAIREALARV